MYSVKQAKTRSVQKRRNSETEERTSHRVLSGVLKHGPVSAASLGEELNLTPAAVRRHLDTLEKDGIIMVAPHKQYGAGAGRPARRYVIAPQGHSRIGNDYLDIAKEALHLLEQQVGSEALHRFATGRFDEMKAKYRPIIEAAGENILDRARALAQALTQDGFVASAAVMDPHPTSGAMHPLLASIQLCQGHCPVRDLAEEFPVFCDVETQLFAELLGVDVRRLSTMADGAHVCTTHIPLERLAVDEQRVL